jgi:hypothetical protein
MNDNLLVALQVAFYFAFHENGARIDGRFYLTFLTYRQYVVIQAYSAVHATLDTHALGTGNEDVTADLNGWPDGGLGADGGLGEHALLAAVIHRLGSTVCGLVFLKHPDSSRWAENGRDLPTDNFSIGHPVVFQFPLHAANGGLTSMAF